jgi:hypothetical protein
LLFLQLRNGGTTARHLILRRGRRVDESSVIRCPCPMHMAASRG